MEILFYILGLITAILFINNKRLKRKLNELELDVQCYKESYEKLKKKEAQKGLKRAQYKWPGWYFTKDKEKDPKNYKTWDVILELIETGKKTKDKVQFDVVYASPKNTNSSYIKQSLSYYKTKWKDHTDNGFIDPSKVDYYIDKTPSEIREKKIKTILDDKKEN